MLLYTTIYILYNFNNLNNQRPPFEGATQGSPDFSVIIFVLNDFLIPLKLTFFCKGLS